MKSIALRPWELAAYMREKKLLVVRPVKPQPTWNDPKHVSVDPPRGSMYPGEWTWWGGNYTQSCYHHARCPFGKPGEVLGIKEAVGFWNHMGTICTPKVEYGDDLQWAYLADQEGVSEEVLSRIRWRPAYRCPLWAVRFKPTIADIRVMRVGEIGDHDAFAAGLQEWVNQNRGNSGDGSAQSAFRALLRKEFAVESGEVWVWATNVVE